MISNHKGEAENELVNRQDTSKNTSGNLLIKTIQIPDSSSTIGESNQLIITKPAAFIPLPGLDSVRVVKPKVYFNPLKTADYLKYQDTYFHLKDGGILFAEKPFDKEQELANIIHQKTKSAQKPQEIIQPDLSTIVSQPTILKEHIISKDSNIKDVDGSTQWILGMLILITILFAWIRVFNNKYLKNINAALFNNQWSKKLYEERNVLSQRNSLVLNVFFLFNASLLIVYILTFFKYRLLHFNGFQTFLAILILISAIYFIKYLLLHFTGWLVLAKSHFGEYIHNVFVYNKLYGIVLFPLLWIIPFVDYNVSAILIYLAIGFFFLGYLLRLIRGINNCIRVKVSIFYLILYLCALEIFPMLIIYKTITSMM